METKGYPWPASRITEKEMSILVDLRKSTGKPITELLVKAVQDLSKTKGGTRL